MENKCEQLDCILNTLGMCSLFREPVWNTFGTKKCKEETEALFEEDAKFEEGAQKAMLEELTLFGETANKDE